MDQKIYLNVPDAMKVFAKRHGAIFTEGLGWWAPKSVYDNNSELWDFAREGPRILSRPLRPTCPLCGGLMIAICNPINSDEYWSCDLRSCKGSRPLGDARIHYEALFGGKEICDSPKKVFHKEYLKILESIFFGTGFHVEDWFLTPNRALGGISPEIALSQGHDQRVVTDLFIKFAREWFDD